MEQATRFVAEFGEFGCVREQFATGSLARQAGKFEPVNSQAGCAIRLRNLFEAGYGG